MNKCFNTKEYYHRLLFVIVAFILTLFVAGPSLADSTIYVDLLGECNDNTPCYSTIQEAVDSASSEATIKIVEGNYDEDVIMDEPKLLILEGGWNSIFSDQSSLTTVGSLKLRQGTVNVNNLVITLPPLPTATTGSATSITSTSATLNGTVNPNGASTTVVFEYGTTTAYDSEVIPVQSPLRGWIAQEVSAGLTDLSPETTYHFRVKAVNSIGTSYGNDKMFTTTEHVYEINIFKEGLASPTGLDIHPENHSLYVKSGTTGRVWSIPIQPDGTAGAISVITEAFVPDMDIVFDAAGNLYGLESNSEYMYRLGTVGDISRMNFYLTDVLHTGITIETPGLPSNSLFFSYGDPYNEIGSIDTNQFIPGGSTRYHDGPDTCGAFRFLFYRQSVGGIAGTYGDSLVNINPSDGSCSIMLSGFVNPNGIAEDDEDYIYVADTGAGTISEINPLGHSRVIASNLQSPTGLVYDSQTRLLFISETGIGRISVITIP
jgi:sugar lactone lactonase YvrE